MVSFHDSTPTVVQVVVKCSPAFVPLRVGIHGLAKPNQTAPLVFDLGTPYLITNVWAVISWSQETYYVTNIFVGCSNTLTLTAQQQKEMKAGLYYVNITSKEYPEGEIRGQINSPTVLSRPESRRAGGFGFSFNATGKAMPSGYQVEVSTNLVHWTALTNLEIKTKHIIRGDLNTDVGSSVEIFDPEGNADGHRFYRVKP